MDKYQKTQHHSWHLALAISALVAASQVHAAPGVLDSVPLFVKSSAEPNIFFTVDDSGSMDFEMMTPETVGDLGTMDTNGGYSRSADYYYTTPNVDHVYNRWVVPTESALGSSSEVWRGRNSSYNKAYYNPTQTYEPWHGQDNAGSTYANASSTAARVNAYLSLGSTLDLTATHSVTTRRPNNSSLTMNLYIPTYYVWVDSNAGDSDGQDGPVDPNDNHREIQIRATTPVCSGGLTASASVQYSSSCMLRPYAAEIQNFANWYQYHRRREYVMKSALTQVVENADAARMGLSTIHNRQRSLNASMTVAANKVALQDTISRIQSDGGTPLLPALEGSGEYYRCNNSNTFNSTIFGGSTPCPVERTAISPATTPAGMCQTNSTILVTDGEYNSGSVSIGNSDNDGSTWVDGPTTYKFDGDQYADGKSNTLADIAMKYYERDLQSLANKVPTQCGVDQNPGQHMVTYTLSFGLSSSLNFSAFPPHRVYNYQSECTATAAATAPAWPTGSLTGSKTIDDLAHAAYNGRGDYMSASSPAELQTALTAMVNNAMSRNGAASAASFNAATLTTGTNIYVSTFNSGGWVGDLASYSLNPVTGAVASTANWSAATQLDAISNASILTAREITTMGASDGVDFQWANLTAAEQADLQANAAGGTDPVARAQAKLEYIRGDRSNEGAGYAFRARDSRLGDMIHSSPIFVGVPRAGWPDGNGSNLFPNNSGSAAYSTFEADNASRAGRVYVGGNDGMLHAYDDANGNESFAYIPGAVYSSAIDSGLHHLTENDYAHKYYVDLTPTINDVYINMGAGTKWKTVAVGGLGGGGRGIYALEMTNPSTLTAANAAERVLWEFTSDDNPNLGYTYSRPMIVPVHATKSVASETVARWAAIFGNGYNADGGDGKGHLFIVFIEKGIDGTWDSGDIIDIPVPAGSIAGSGDCQDAASNCNGISSPTAVDLDGDSIADRIYAGDLLGNVWAFDISDSNTSNWGIAHGSGAAPLFVAKDSASKPQPITMRPEVAKTPGISDTPTNLPNVLVMVGTGQYLTDNDRLNGDTQTMYGVWDDDATGNKTRADLVAQTSTMPLTDWRLMSDNTVVYGTNDGWYYDFPDTRERSVTDTVLRGGILYFRTTIPSPEPCDAGGSGWFMALDIQNGGRPDEAVMDRTGDGLVDSSDLLGGNALGGTRVGLTGGTNIIGDRAYHTNVDSTTATGQAIQQLDGGKTGRLSWKELFEE